MLGGMRLGKEWPFSRHMIRVRMVQCIAVRDELEMTMLHLKVLQFLACAAFALSMLGVPTIAQQREVGTRIEFDSLARGKK
jgi:hypothetical protein